MSALYVNEFGLPPGMKRYRCGARMVEAIQFDGSSVSAEIISAFAGASASVHTADHGPRTVVRLSTPFGPRQLQASDWVVRTGAGQFAAMADRTFFEHHEPLEA